MNLEKLYNSVKSGVPYASRPSGYPVTPAAYAALGRASSVRGGLAVIGGYLHGLVRRGDGLYVLGIGEDTPGDPTDPDVGGPIDPDAVPELPAA